MWRKNWGRLQKLGVISYVNGYTDRVSQLVVVEKKSSDRVRLWTDPRPQKMHYNVNTTTCLPEEVTPELGKAKIFTKGDLWSAY